MGELLKALKNYADSGQLPMHMPGHKRRTGGIGNPYFIDITEIKGFDNLHHANGILLDAQKRAADLYHSEETHYLVNGSTAGILACISGCTAFGGKMLMARNCHKSAYHAVLLRGLQTFYLYPQSTGDMGINGAILPDDVKKMLEDHPDIQAVLITSPTYDGIASDVRKIAETVHEYGIPLIVDEAHGAHFPFSDDFPEDSVSCGADAVIHSLHKTLPALTQSALIHLNGPFIDRKKIRQYLTIYQTSSPSYVLMAGMDECVGWIQTHPEAFQRFAESLCRLRKALYKMRHLRLLEAAHMDFSKILISVQRTALCGQELAEILRNRYQIEAEMACHTYVCMITTVSDTEESLKRLEKALLSIDSSLSDSPEEKSCIFTDEVSRTRNVYTIFQAEEEEKESIFFTDACGRISGDFITLYPPGIPILVPGEIITEEIKANITGYMRDGLQVEGIDDGRICVIRKERQRTDGENILSDGEKFIRKRYHI